jgi:laccase
MVLMIAGDWWEENLAEMAWNMTKGIFLSYASASTVNGLVGDLFNCSGNQ